MNELRNQKQKKSIVRHLYKKSPFRYSGDQLHAAICTGQTG